MGDRRADLKALIERLEEHDDVRDAWLAKSFTDRLLVVETAPDSDLPPTVEQTLLDANLRGADEVYDADAADAAYAGQLADGKRYRFVDCECRGELQSYVVD